MNFELKASKSDKTLLIVLVFVCTTASERSVHFISPHCLSSAWIATGVDSGQASCKQKEGRESTWMGLVGKQSKGQGARL